MWKQILFWILRHALDALYNFIDKDNDGKISKEEIDILVSILRQYAKDFKVKSQP